MFIISHHIQLYGKNILNKRSCVLVRNFQELIMLASNFTTKNKYKYKKFKINNTKSKKYKLIHIVLTFNEIFSVLFCYNNIFVIINIFNYE